MRKCAKALLILFSVLLCACNENPIISSETTSENWYDNPDVLPQGYTTIEKIVTKGKADSVFQTRGVITSKIGDCFTLQSKEHAIYIYTDHLDNSRFKVGDVVNVTGTKSVFQYMPSLTAINVSMFSSTGVYKINPKEVKYYDWFDFCNLDYTNKLIQLSGALINSASSDSASLKYGDQYITIHLSNDLPNKHEIASYLQTIAGNNLVYDVVGTLYVSGYSDESYSLRISDINNFTEIEDEEISTIYISSNKQYVTVGSTLQFHENIAPISQDGMPVEWSVSGGGEIDNSGLFTATESGEYTVTVCDATDESVFGTMNFTVIDAQEETESIEITTDTATFYQYHDYKFDANVMPSTVSKDVVWSCTNGTISSCGAYFAKEDGSDTIVAKAKDNNAVVAQFDIEVKESKLGNIVDEPSSGSDFIGPLYTPNTNEQLSINMLEMVEQYGDSVLIDYGNFEILIDAGQQSDNSNVISMLKRRVEDGCLEMIVATHPHSDHIGGLRTLNGSGITSIKYIVDYGCVYSSSYSTSYENLRTSFINKGTQYFDIYSMFNGENKTPNIFKITDDISLTFLESNAYFPKGQVIEESDSLNDCSIACVLSFGNNRYICAGDLTGFDVGNAETKDAESYIIEKALEKHLWSDSTFNIVKANHHASKSYGSNGDNWVNGTSADMLLVSAALVTANRTKSGVMTNQHPRKAAIRRYQTHTNEIYANTVNGTIHVCFDDYSNSNYRLVNEGRSFNYYHNGLQVSPMNDCYTNLIDSLFYKDLMEVQYS